MSRVGHIDVAGDRFSGDGQRRCCCIGSRIELTVGIPRVTDASKRSQHSGRRHDVNICVSAVDDRSRDGVDLNFGRRDERTKRHIH